MDILQRLTPQLLPSEQFLSPRDYLPHDNPMIFIDELLAVQDDAIVTRTYVAPQHNLSLFLERTSGELSSHFSIEIMAQSIGAWSGYHRLKRGDGPLKVGMLLSVRNLRITPSQIKTGTVMTTVMRLLMIDGKCGTFEGTIYRRSTPAAAATAVAPACAAAGAVAPDAAGQQADEAVMTALGTPWAAGRLTTLEVEDSALSSLFS